MTYSVSYVNGHHETQAPEPRAHPRHRARPRRAHHRLLALGLDARKDARAHRGRARLVRGDDPGRDAPLPARARPPALRRGTAPGRERVRVLARPAPRRARTSGGLALREL